VGVLVCGGGGWACFGLRVGVFGGKERDDRWHSSEGSLRKPEILIGLLDPAKTVRVAQRLAVEIADLLGAGHSRSFDKCEALFALGRYSHLRALRPALDCGASALARPGEGKADAVGEDAAAFRDRAAL